MLDNKVNHLHEKKILEKVNAKKHILVKYREWIAYFYYYTVYFNVRTSLGPNLLKINKYFFSLIRAK